MLVVLNHTAGTCSTSHIFEMQMHTFRMPLYFILSGLFFKEYEVFWGFLKRKTNKLLIPFIFWYGISSLIAADINGSNVVSFTKIFFLSGISYNVAIFGFYFAYLK